MDYSTNILLFTPIYTVSVLGSQLLRSPRGGEGSGAELGLRRRSPDGLGCTIPRCGLPLGRVAAVGCVVPPTDLIGSRVRRAM
jgi:hypothetical protein